MIFIALGANLPSRDHHTPRETLERALAQLAEAGIAVVARSRWYRSAPVPISDQPWYVNGVAAVATELPAAELLSLMQGIEDRFGRVRAARNASRVLDLDLLAYHDQVISAPPALLVPHPRLAERAFVVLPLMDIAPDWVHPVSGKSVGELAKDLPGDQAIQVMDNPSDC